MSIPRTAAGIGCDGAGRGALAGFAAMPDVELAGPCDVPGFASHEETS